MKKLLIYGVISVGMITSQIELVEATQVVDTGSEGAISASAKRLQANLASISRSQEIDHTTKIDEILQNSRNLVAAFKACSEALDNNCGELEALTNYCRYHSNAVVRMIVDSTGTSLARNYWTQANNYQKTLKQLFSNVEEIERYIEAICPLLKKTANPQQLDISQELLNILKDRILQNETEQNKLIQDLKQFSDNSRTALFPKLKTFFEECKNLYKEKEESNPKATEWIEQTSKHLEYLQQMQSNNDLAEKIENLNKAIHSLRESVYNYQERVKESLPKSTEERYPGMRSEIQQEGLHALKVLAERLQDTYEPLVQSGVIWSDPIQASLDTIARSCRTIAALQISPESMPELVSQYNWLFETLKGLQNNIPSVNERLKKSIQECVENATDKKKLEAVKETINGIIEFKTQLTYFYTYAVSIFGAFAKYSQNIEMKTDPNLAQPTATLATPPAPTPPAPPAPLAPPPPPALGGAAKPLAPPPPPAPGVAAKPVAAKPFESDLELKNAVDELSLTAIMDGRRALPAFVAMEYILSGTQPERHDRMIQLLKNGSGGFFWDAVTRAAESTPPLTDKDKELLPGIEQFASRLDSLAKAINDTSLRNFFKADFEEISFTSDKTEKLSPSAFVYMKSYQVLKEWKKVWDDMTIRNPNVSEQVFKKAFSFARTLPQVDSSTSLSHAALCYLALARKDKNDQELLETFGMKPNMVGDTDNKALDLLFAARDRLIQKRAEWLYRKALQHLSSQQIRGKFKEITMNEKCSFVLSSPMFLNEQEEPLRDIIGKEVKIFPIDGEAVWYIVHGFDPSHSSSEDPDILGSMFKVAGLQQHQINVLNLFKDLKDIETTIDSEKFSTEYGKTLAKRILSTSNNYKYMVNNVYRLLSSGVKLPSNFWLSTKKAAMVQPKTEVQPKKQQNFAIPGILAGVTNQLMIVPKLQPKLRTLRGEYEVLFSEIENIAKQFELAAQTVRITGKQLNPEEAIRDINQKVENTLGILHKEVIFDSATNTIKLPDPEKRSSTNELYPRIAFLLLTNVEKIITQAPDDSLYEGSKDPGRLWLLAFAKEAYPYLNKVSEEYGRAIGVLKNNPKVSEQEWQKAIRLIEGQITSLEAHWPKEQIEKARTYWETGQKQSSTGTDTSPREGEGTQPQQPLLRRVQSHQEDAGAAAPAASSSASSGQSILRKTNQGAGTASAATTPQPGAPFGQRTLRSVQPRPADTDAATPSQSSTSSSAPFGQGTLRPVQSRPAGTGAATSPQSSTSSSAPFGQGTLRSVQSRPADTGAATPPQSVTSSAPFGQHTLRRVTRSADAGTAPQPQEMTELQKKLARHRQD